MKSIYFCFISILALLLYVPTQAIAQPASNGVVGLPASSNIRGAAYPKVLPDSRVVFNIKAPNAQKVQIDLGKKYDLQKDALGTWAVTTDSISEGFHYYSLLVDGLPVADPASQTFYGMSRMASGIEIPFTGGGYYALRDVPHGDVRIKRYFSSVTHTWRRFFIYTPPSYDVATKEKYPVLYLMHGGGEDETGWATQGKTDLIMDNLIADKKAKPMLIVMADGNVGGSAFEESGLKIFESELKTVIIPLVEKDFRVKTDAANRALAGLSMGGINTLYTGIKNTDLFSALGVFSSGWIMPMQSAIANAQYDLMKSDPAVINKNLKHFWIAMGGKEDIAYKNCQIMLAKLDELKIKYSYSQYPGGHTWPVWRNNLYNFAPLLFKD